MGISEVPRVNSFCTHTVSQDAALIVEDAREAPDFVDNPYVLGDPGVRFYAGYPLHASGGEPVGTLCIADTVPQEFDKHRQEMLRELAQWAQGELDRELEMDNAELIQRSMCPDKNPEVPGYTIAAALVPRGRLSGDFYDLFVRDGMLRITIADVMGKGVGPALIAAGIRSSLRTAPERPLAEAMAEADRLMAEDIGETGVFATAIHADLNLATGQLELFDAGHGLAFIIGADGTWIQLRSINLPLGMGDAAAGEPTSVDLQPGDTLVCCSDGLLDVLDAEDPFRQVEKAITMLGPVEAVQEAVRLAHDERAVDDITVIAIRREQ